jgi:hypothetical protein
MFLLGILIFKGLTARRLYKSFDVKGLKNTGHLVAPTPVHAVVKPAKSSDVFTTLAPMLQQCRVAYAALPNITMISYRHATLTYHR